MSSQFDILEKKLNIANDLINELGLDDIENLPELTETKLPALTEEFSNEVFTLDTLKADFILIRQSILKQMASGQRIIDSCSVLDPSDIKPATLSAIAELQNSLASSTQLLVKVYAEVAKIELTRSKSNKPPDTPGVTNTGTIVNNNTQVLFSGDTNALLGFLKENQKQ